MTTKHCKNCERLRGFKRSIGLGTLVMIVITSGFWLLLVPFYPKHCVVCGVS